ncbi:MAG: WecB/TagA/CpsF family glycosyltransferase, partial [Parcubacteria group bacterium]|nr:WecB/TagA/CpsF family glycosyltransferase [Parcubacteria group bacterium]
MNQDSENRIEILGVKINTFTKDQVINKIDRFLELKEKNFIVTPNPEFIMEAQRGRRFRNILNIADISIPDGIGLLWASSFLRSKSKLIYLSAIYYGLALMLYPKYCQKVIPERISGTDLVLDIAKLCEQKNRTMFLLGAEEGVAEACALNLKKKYPNLKISGTYSGSPKQKYDQKIVNIVNKTKPDVLLVAYGHSKQEKWINRNLNNLEFVKMAIGVGGAFDFISGKARRAPRIFRKTGLEWFYRVIRQPWRLNRILTATWRFSNEVIKYKLENNKK